MNKFYGPVGYAVSVETRPGFYQDRIEEHNYYGDVLRFNTSWNSSSESTNDDLKLNNQISIVADPFANNHFYSMKYIRFMGANWKITNIEPQPPRLKLTIGGVYNGPTADSGKA